jgi:hypothetical protein
VAAAASAATGAPKNQKPLRNLQYCVGLWSCDRITVGLATVSHFCYPCRTNPEGAGVGVGTTRRVGRVGVVTFYLGTVRAFSFSVFRASHAATTEKTDGVFLPGRT